MSGGRFVLCHVRGGAVDAFFSGGVRLAECTGWGFAPVEAEITVDVVEAFRFSSRIDASRWAYRLLATARGSDALSWEVRPLAEAVIGAPTEGRFRMTPVLAAGVGGTVADLDAGRITRNSLRDWAAAVLLEVGGIQQRQAPDFTDRVDRVVSDCLATLVERRVAINQELMR